MATKTSKSSNGTSFHNTIITTTVNKLKSVLGEPDHEDNTGQDKSNFDFVGETKDNKVFTVYDWKEYRPIGEDEEINFHIGGFCQLDTIAAKEELLNQIK